MFKNHVDNFKLDTNISLILQNSRKTIKDVKDYLAEPDELNFAIQDVGNLSSNKRPGLNFKEVVNKTVRVPPVWDENLHKIYIKSLVENYLSPRISEEESKLNAPNNVVVRSLSNEPVLKLVTANSQMETNNNLETILVNDNLDLQKEDLACNLQWKPIKRNSEVQTGSNSKSILPGKQKKAEQQKTVDIPKTEKSSDKNKKRITGISNKRSNDIPDLSKMYSNSARSSRMSDGKNPKSSKIEPTFIRFIGKQTKNPIDFNKEHPGLIVETSENCKTLFPRRFLKTDKTISNNTKEIEGKIPSSELQENKTVRLNTEKDRAKLISKNNIESKKEDNLRKQVTTKSKPQILHSENNKSNNEPSKTRSKCNEATSEELLHSLEMEKEELNQNLDNNKKLDIERSQLSRDEFARRILNDFIEYQKTKNKIKKRSKIEISASTLPCDTRKNQISRSPNLLQNELDTNFLSDNVKDTSCLENTSIRKENKDPTWHDVFKKDKIVESPIPIKEKISALTNKISEDKDIPKIDKNLEIIYDKSNRFEVKKISASNNEKLKKLQIKTLPIFCIRGECKVQKTVSIEIKPTEEFLEPFKKDNVQYSHVVYNIKNNEEVEANNINVIEKMQTFPNDETYENEIRKRFHVINPGEISTGNLTFNAKNSLSTIDETDDDNYCSENCKNFVNKNSQCEKVPIISGQKYSSMLISNEQNLSPIDSNIDEEAILLLNTQQHKAHPSSNPMLTTTSATSGILNEYLDETLTTQTDEEKLCIKKKSAASDTNLSDEDSSEIDIDIDSSIKIPKNKVSSTSIDCNDKYQKNCKINQSTDFLSILENVFLKALKSNRSLVKQSKESSSSSSRSLLDSSQFKRKEAIKKKYFDLTKKNHPPENVFKEVSVQTDEISNQMGLLRQSPEQDIRENLVEDIFEKIRNDVPAGLKEFKSYKQSKIEKFALTEPNNDYEDYNKDDVIEKDLPFDTVINNTQVNLVSSSSLISVTSNENKKNNKLKIFDDRPSENKSEANFEEQGKSNIDTFRQYPTYRRLSNNSKSCSQVSEKLNINENLPCNLNIDLDDGNLSMFSLGSNGIVIDKINYQCRSADITDVASSKDLSQSSKKIQNPRIAKTVEKVLKDGESFRSNTTQKYSKESKNDCSAEVQNAVKYFLDNLNSSNDSVNNKYKKTNNMCQIPPEPSLHNINHYPSLINPNIKKQSKYDLDLSNILGCSSKHNKTFNISEKSSETSSTDKLMANNSFQIKSYHLNKSFLNSYGNSSTSSQRLKNYHLEKESSFEQFLTERMPDLSSNIDLNELYYSSTDDFLLSEQEQKKFLTKDSDSKNTGDILSVSDGEILSMGEIKDK